jgi:polyferredoxin
MLPPLEYSTHRLAFHRAAPPARGEPAGRRSFTRRRGDRSQLVRRSFQWAFLLLNLWIGARFYLFVRYFETGGRTAAVPRPPGVEGWLPIAGLMNLKYLWLTGRVPDIHPAGLFLLVAFLAISFTFRKAFCSWLCPVGTVSEWLWQGGRELFRSNVALPRWLDIPLRAPKYLVLGFFAWAVARMSAADISGFLASPYGLVADVKMLGFFRDLGVVGASILAVLAGLSLVVPNAWCRFLCPYGALLGLASMASPTRIRRDAAACIDCGKCARVCPSRLPVDRLASVRSAECTGCLECVAACPARGALDVSIWRRPVPAAVVAVGIAVLFLGIVAFARLSGHWRTDLPEPLYFDLIPRAATFGHPPAG